MFAGKTTSSIIAAFLLLHCLLSGMNCIPGENPAQKLFKSRAAVQYASSLCMVPLDALNSLLTYENTLKTNKTPVKKTEKKSEHSLFADCSLPTAVSIGYRSIGMSLTGNAAPLSAAGTVLLNSIELNHHPPPGYSGFIYLFLLLILCSMIRPRSSVADGILSFCLNR